MYLFGKSWQGLTRSADVVMAKEVETKYGYGDKPWIAFEHVTMTPICKRLVEPSLLDENEKKWLNDYHQEIWKKTSPYFENDELTKAWLKKETSPL